jgi:hypothetical protein
VYLSRPMASKKTSKKPVTKTAFVHSRPSSMSGADVVKKAKEAGIKITLDYVYSIRAKANAKREAEGRRAVKRGPARPPRSMSNGNSSAGAPAVSKRRSRLSLSGR